MGEINTLFSQYSFAELIVLILLLLFAGQGIWKLIEFYYGKYQISVGKKLDENKWENEIKSSLAKIAEKIDHLNIQNQETHKKQEATDVAINLMQERLQENARSDLIDAHHQFCYQYKQIDDLSLQSLERRYLYYKTAGGDTFIDHLMEEVRALPRVNYTTANPEGGN